MQPHRGGDNAERETGEAGDKRRGKRSGGEQGEIECRESVHGVPHAGPPGMSRGGGWGNLGRPRWLRGGCLDLRLSLAAVSPKSTGRCTNFGLVAADMIPYMSRHGVMQ